MLKNSTGIDLSLAVWLAAQDGYDLKYDPKVVSATDLLKPIRSLILGRRVAASNPVYDIDNMVASRLGHAVHDAVERAWLDSHEVALRNLGYPQHVIDRIRINPTEDEPNMIPVYLEQRSSKDIGGYTVSGKFDIVIDGQLSDVKSTKTYTYINGSNDRKYALQGSIYRWLNPDIITQDHLQIQYLFTDWMPFKAQSDPNYPKSRILTKSLEMLTMQQTEAFIRDRLGDLAAYEHLDQADLPECNRVELWQDPPKYALYKDPNNRKRATKVFDNQADAIQWNAEKYANAGHIETREGTPTFCMYCPANSVCTQAEQFVLKGILKL
jgi:hypothetical protein